MQEQVYSWNMALKYVRSALLRVWSAEPDHAEPNQALHRQIFMRDQRSSGMLRSVEWHFLTDVSGQPIDPNFKGL
jgi:hypothetical protein